MRMKFSQRKNEEKTNLKWEKKNRIGDVIDEMLKI